jgi:hypothetical protein
MSSVDVQTRIPDSGSARPVRDRWMQRRRRSVENQSCPSRGGSNVGVIEQRIANSETVDADIQPAKRRHRRCSRLWVVGFSKSDLLRVMYFSQARS